LILLAVDELEQLRLDQASGHLDSSLLPFLRSQIQHRRGITFLFCGAEGLLDSYWHPIVNLAATRELGPLTRSETDSLVRKPLAGRANYDDRAVNRIWQETSGHPYHIQVICHRLVSRLNENHGRDRVVTENDVEWVIAEITKLNLLTPLQQPVILEGTA
jgi:hypothetical protein